jgi:hypothetical protein
MLTEGIVRYPRMSVNYANSIGAFVIYWDRKREKVVLTTSKIRWTICIFFFLSSIVIFFAVLERIILFVRGQLPNEPMMLLLMVAYELCLLVPVVIIGGTILALDDVLACANRFLGYMKSIEGKTRQVSHFGIKLSTFLFNRKICDWLELQKLARRTKMDATGRTLYESHLHCRSDPSNCHCSLFILLIHAEPTSPYLFHLNSAIFR